MKESKVLNSNNKMSRDNSIEYNFRPISAVNKHPSKKQSGFNK